MKTEKYPVISKNGNEYMVEVDDREYYNEGVCVKISTIEEYKSFLFKKTKIRETSYSVIIIARQDLEFDKASSSFVHAAKIGVDRLELGKEEERKRALEDERIKKEFEEWDGKC